jgi:hypothetical protein
VAIWYIVTILVLLDRERSGNPVPRFLTAAPRFQLPEEFVHVSDALGILSSRLVHDDKKSSEMACLALSRLAESYKNDRNRLRDIATPVRFFFFLPIFFFIYFFFFYGPPRVPRCRRSLGKVRPFIYFSPFFATPCFVESGPEHKKRILFSTEIVVARCRAQPEFSLDVANLGLPHFRLRI